MKIESLTTADIIKLTIPFISSLILIWIKFEFDKYSEKRYKLKHLCMGIKQTFANDCREGINALRTTKNKLINNDVVFFALDFPKTLTDFAQRLAELDYKSSYLYSDYIAQVEIVRKGHAALQSMLIQAAFKDANGKDIPERIKNAIFSQINALRCDMVDKSDAELKLLKHSKYIDKQDIDIFENLLTETKNECNANPI